MPNLDGKDKIAATPFDAHEQATRGRHVPTKVDGPDINPKTVREFPKAVDHVDKPNAPEGHKEPVVATNAEEEKAYQASQSEAKSQANQATE